MARERVSLETDDATASKLKLLVQLPCKYVPDMVASVLAAAKRSTELAGQDRHEMLGELRRWAREQAARVAHAQLDALVQFMETAIVPVPGVPEVLRVPEVPDVPDVLLVPIVPDVVMDGAMHTTKQHDTMRRAIFISFLLTWKPSRTTQPALWIVRFDDLHDLASFVEGFEPDAQCRFLLAAVFKRYLERRPLVDEASPPDSSDSGDDSGDSDDDSDADVSSMLRSIPCFSDRILHAPLPKTAGRAARDLREGSADWDAMPPFVPLLVAFVDGFRASQCAENQATDYDFSSNLVIACYVESDARAMTMVIPTTHATFAAISMHVLKADS